MQADAPDAFYPYPLNIGWLKPPMQVLRQQEYDIGTTTKLTLTQKYIKYIRWQTKVCCVFKKLTNILCWPTMLAVYTVVTVFQNRTDTALNTN